MAYIEIPAFTKINTLDNDTEFVIVVDGVEYLVTFKTLSDKFGNTPELLQQINAEIEALRAIVDAFPTENPAAPIALKISDTPTIDGLYKPTETGVYPNAGGLEYDPTEGITYFIRTSGVWTKDVTPINFTPTGVVEEENTEAVSGGNVYNEFSKILSETDNLFNGIFEAGYYTAVGDPHPSTNWIRTPFKKVPSSLKGQQVTISGFGICPSGGARVLTKDVNGSVISTIVGAGSGDLNPVTFVIPLNADIIGFSIANDASDGGIGTRPNNNEYVDSFMWNIGDTALPYQSPNRRINTDMLDYPVKEEDLKNKNEIYDINSILSEITITSSNLIDTSTDVEAGYYAIAGHQSVSINWIRTKRLLVPENIKGQKATISGGGRVSEGSARVVIRNSEGVILSSIAGNNPTPYPFTFDVPSDAYDWAFTIANQATDGGIGTRPTNNDYTTTFQVEAGEQATTPIPLGDVYLDGDKIVYTSGNTDFNTNEIVLIKTNATTCQLLIHTGGDNDIWFKTTFYRQTNVDRFIDTWRLNEGFIVRRTGDFTFVNVKQVILSGVWENAIYTSGSGYTDALGSAHGWEQLVETSIFLDGNKIDLNTITIGVKGSYFNVFQRSNFKTSDGLNDIGVSLKEWQIKNGTITIKNTINWLGTLNVGQNSYLSMLSVMRKNGETQVTTSALSNEDMNVYDVSEFGFETPIYTNGTDPKRTNIVIWGDDFKASMNVSKRKVIKSTNEVLYDGLPNAGMYVQNTELYNKLYGRFGSDTVANGDIWEVETVYKISL